MRMEKKSWIAILALVALALACGTPTAEPTGAPTEPQAAESEVPTGIEPTEPGPTAVSPTAIPTAPTATSEACTPDSEYVADLAPPDGTLISPAETFTKGWRIRNAGDCTWTGEYTWEQINASGNKLLGTPLSIPIPVNVPPGGTLDISVQLTLSGSATLGVKYRAQFQMRSPSGELFGTHPYIDIFAVNGTGKCPIGTASQETFIRLDDRYCFLYPDDYDAYIATLGDFGDPGDTIVKLPSLPGPGGMWTPFASVSNMGSTGGMSLSAWSSARIAAEMACCPPTMTNTTIGGEPAKVGDTIAYQFETRVVYVIHNNIGFELMFSPIGEGPWMAETLSLWEMIRSSWVWFNP
jgi:hypothetical protein